jgi:hypothetical protein
MGIQNLNSLVNLKATGGITNSGLPVSQGGSGPNKIGTAVVSIRKQQIDGTSIARGAGGGILTKPSKRVTTNGTLVANPSSDAILPGYHVPFPPVNNGGLYQSPPYDGSTSIFNVAPLKYTIDISQQHVSATTPASLSGQNLNALVQPGVIPSIGQGRINGAKR